MVEAIPAPRTPQMRVKTEATFRGVKRELGARYQQPVKQELFADVKREAEEVLSETERIERRLQWLNKNGSLAVPIRVRDALTALDSIGLRQAMRVLRRLEESAATVDDPNEFIRDLVARSGWIWAKPDVIDDDVKVAKRVAWLNQFGGLARPIKWVEVADILDGLRVPHAMVLLRELEVNAATVARPTEYIKRVAARAGEDDVLVPIDGAEAEEVAVKRAAASSMPQSLLLARAAVQRAAEEAAAAKRPATQGGGAAAAPRGPAHDGLLYGFPTLPNVGVKREKEKERKPYIYPKAEVYGENNNAEEEAEEAEEANDDTWAEDAEWADDAAWGDDAAWAEDADAGQEWDGYYEAPAVEEPKPKKKKTGPMRIVGAITGHTRVVPNRAEPDSKRGPDPWSLLKKEAKEEAAESSSQPGVSNAKLSSSQTGVSSAKLSSLPLTPQQKLLQVRSLAEKCGLHLDEVCLKGLARLPFYRVKDMIDDVLLGGRYRTGVSNPSRYLMNGLKRMGGGLGVEQGIAMELAVSVGVVLNNDALDELASIPRKESHAIIRELSKDETARLDPMEYIQEEVARVRSSMEASL